METILEWQAPEHRFDKKGRDWYWILGIVVIAAAVLAFYFNNFLFGVFLVIAGITIGILSYKETKIVSVRMVPKGVIFDRRLYPWGSFRSFWIEDEHLHGARILLHPVNSLLPLVVIPIDNETDLNDIRDLLLEFLEEEFLEESLLHRWFDKLLAK